MKSQDCVSPKAGSSSESSDLNTSTAQSVVVYLNRRTRRKHPLASPAFSNETAPTRPVNSNPSWTRPEAGLLANALFEEVKAANRGYSDETIWEMIDAL